MRMRICRVVLSCLLIGAAAVVADDAAADKAIRIGGAEWPPYSYAEVRHGKADPASPRGIDGETITAVFAEMGVPVASHRIYPWKRLLKYVRDGEVDVGYEIIRTPEREREFLMAEEPLIVSEEVFFIRKADVGKLRFDKMDDLAGHTIGVTRGYAYTAEFWKFIKSECRYEEVWNDELNLRKLIGGRIDFFPVNRNVGLFLARENGCMDKIAMLPKPLCVNKQYIFFSRGTVSPEFVRRVSGALSRFKRTPAYRAIFKKHLGSEAPDPPSPVTSVPEADSITK